MNDTEPTEPADEELPKPGDPEFVRMVMILNKRSAASRAAKSAALDEWSREATDEEIRDELGIDMNALRQDPNQDE